MPIELGSFSLGTVVGGVVVGVFNHYLAKSRTKEDRDISGFNSAAKQFTDAFSNTIFALRENVKYGKARAGDVVNQTVVTPHEKAKIMFEQFIPASDLSSFNAAWEKYRYGERNRTDDQDNPDVRKKVSQIYLDHIDELLKFAKPK